MECAMVLGKRDFSAVQLVDGGAGDRWLRQLGSSSWDRDGKENIFRGNRQRPGRNGSRNVNYSQIKARQRCARRVH